MFYEIRNLLFLLELSSNKNLVHKHVAALTTSAPFGSVKYDPIQRNLRSYGDLFFLLHFTSQILFRRKQSNFSLTQFFHSDFHPLLIVDKSTIPYFCTLVPRRLFTSRNAPSNSTSSNFKKTNKVLVTSVLIHYATAKTRINRLKPHTAVRQHLVVSRQQSNIHEICRVLTTLFKMYGTKALNSVKGKERR